MAKYLPNYGWKPVVICSEWTAANCPRYDEGFGGPAVAGMVAARVTAPRDLTRVDNVSDAFRKAGRFLAGYRNPPEWSRAALRAADEVVAMHSPDVIWATYPFRASLYVAHAVSKRHGIPWIADFRDVLEQTASPWRRIIESHNERSVVKTASAITTVSPGLVEVLAARHARPVECIPNGFDLEEFDAVEPAGLPGFSIVYTGSVKAIGSPVRYSPRVLFGALDKLAMAGHIHLPDIYIYFFGCKLDELRFHMQGYVSAERVQTKDWAPRSEVYSVQKGASLLLLLGSETMKGIMTGKVFEYLAARKPVLALPSDQDCIDALLTATSAGASATTVDEVSRLLLGHYQSWKQKGDVKYRGRAAVIDQYDRRRQAGHLARLLEKAKKEQ